VINAGVWFESFGNVTVINYGASDFRTWAAVKQKICWVPAKEKQQRLEEKKEMVG